MVRTRRQLASVLLAIGGWLLFEPLRRRLGAQDQAPNRREFTISARNYQFSPDRIEIMRDDLVRLTIASADQAHSFTVDEYRIVKRIPADGTTTFEFRADRVGTFAFYCNLTTDPGCKAMRGTLVVRGK